MGKLRVGIDARLYGADDRGIGRYTAQVLSALLRHAPEIEPVAFVSRPNVAATAGGNDVRCEKILAPFRAYSWQEQLLFPRVLAKARVALMHFPHFNVPLWYRGSYVMTVHDLILHHYPARIASTRSWPVYAVKYLLYRAVLSRALSRAQSIITVSEYTKEDVVTHYPKVAERLTVVGEVVSSPGKTKITDSSMILPYTKGTPYVLTVGAFYPHKNLTVVLRAWSAIYARTGVKLLLVGKHDAFFERSATRAGLTRAALMSPDGAMYAPGHVSDEMLFGFYAGARFLFVPSLEEGYGLPGLEALMSGTSVVSAPHGALPEVYGDRVVYVPVQTTAVLQAAILYLLQHPKKIIPPIQPPVLNSREFARRLAGVYRKAASNHV